MKKLPEPKELFDRFVSPHYSPEDRERLHPRVHGDLEHYLKSGLEVTDICPWNAETQVRVKNQIQCMVEAAQGDWSRYLKLEGPLDFTWIAPFDRHWNRKRIAGLIEDSDPAEDNNDYLIVCIELAAVLGTQMISLDPGFIWICERPYWESHLYHRPSGNCIHVFSWAVKKLSDYGWNDGLESKVKALVEGLKLGKFD